MDSTCDIVPMCSPEWVLLVVVPVLSMALPIVSSMQSIVVVLAASFDVIFLRQVIVVQGL